VLTAFVLQAATALADGVRVGSEAEVTSDDGLNLRAKPDYGATVMSTVKGGHVVFVMDSQKGDDGPWYQVEYDGDVGWVLGSYLGAARPRELSSRGNAGGRGDETPRSTADRAGGGTNTNVKVGSEAEVDTNDGVNLRASPDTTSKIVTVINQSKYVYIVDGPQVTDAGSWFKVDYDGDIGWVLGSFLSPARARQAPPERREDPAPARPAAAAPAPKPAPSAPVAAPVDPPARAASNGGLGSQIAQKALGLVGSPYAWGGTNPRSGFDCSGLVTYVMGAYGVYPGRTSYTQAGAGRSVDSNSLQPGDIVVFANTYAGGADHTGIYIGGGRFVHAEDYGTGVVVSSVFGGYWGRHYAGARRPY
jgi:cell wall-associated NlpC family hydrolase